MPEPIEYGDWWKSISDYMSKVGTLLTGNGGSTDGGFDGSSMYPRPPEGSSANAANTLYGESAGAPPGTPIGDAGTIEITGQRPTADTDYSAAAIRNGDAVFSAGTFGPPAGATVNDAGTMTVTAKKPSIDGKATLLDPTEYIKSLGNLIPDVEEDIPQIEITGKRLPKDDTVDTTGDIPTIEITGKKPVVDTWTPTDAELRFDGTTWDTPEAVVRYDGTTYDDPVIPTTPPLDPVTPSTVNVGTTTMADPGNGGPKLDGTATGGAGGTEEGVADTLLTKKGTGLGDMLGSMLKTLLS